MKYLSFDIEATGLKENDYIIEFACIPFCLETKTFENNLALHFLVKCPDYESLKPHLDPWVIEHNKDLIINASQRGISIDHLRDKIESWATSSQVKEYFKTNPKEKIILFGKSLNAIDLPFLNRDLGFEFMRKYFHHQTFDLSSVVMSLVDMKKLPKECLSGSGLMKHFKMGDVAHNALEDAQNTAKLYLEMIKAH